MEEQNIHPGSFLSDLDIYIDLCSSKVDLGTLRKITTSLSEFVTTLSPEVMLIERSSVISETGSKTLRKFKLHFYIK